jgi:hypothetical protein
LDDGDAVRDIAGDCGRQLNLLGLLLGRKFVELIGTRGLCDRVLADLLEPI